MDIFQEKKKQKYLILVGVGMVLIAVGVLSYGRFSNRDIIMPGIEVNQYRKPIINWAVLESPELKELQIP
jgi:hypothetical protein